MCSHRGTDRGAGGKNEIDRHHLVLDQVAIKANLLTVLVQQHHIRNRRFAIKTPSLLCPLPERYPADEADAGHRIGPSTPDSQIARKPPDL